MATECNPQGVTIIEIDQNGAITNTTSGFGQVWRTPNPTDCGSSDQLSALVLAPDPKSLKTIVDEAQKNRTFDGDPEYGTSVTSCQCSVYRQADATLPQPSPDDHPYFVMAQGNWTDKNGQVLKNVPHNFPPRSKYVASAFIISRYPINQVPHLMDTWQKIKDHAETARKSNAV